MPETVASLIRQAIHTLTVPAAEYCPAIPDAWAILERALAALASQAKSEARDAARYRWLRGFATPGQRPAKEDMPMGYREIRLRVDTAVYMPSNWAKDVDRLIDAAMAEKEQTR